MFSAHGLGAEVHDLEGARHAEAAHRVRAMP